MGRSVTAAVQEFTRGITAAYQFSGAFTVHLWYEPNGVLAGFGYLIHYDNIAGDHGSWTINNSTGVQFEMDDGVGGVFVANSGSNPASGWHSVTARRKTGAAAADQSIFFDGTESTSDRNTSAAPSYPGVTGLHIGSWDGVILLGNAQYANVTIWDVDLSDNEIAALSRGVNPNRIRSLNIVSFTPLLGLNNPEPDFSPNDLTVSGTGASANHGPVALLTPPWAAAIPFIEAGPAVTERHQTRHMISPVGFH